MTTSLYRFYDDEHQLLYVGISSRLGRRLHEHAKTQPWYSDISTATVEHFDTRTEAEDAERTAIQEEHPLHNIVHNRRQTVTATPIGITWTCDICSQPIEDNDGALIMWHNDLGIFTRTKKQHETRITPNLTIVDFLDQPDLVHWNQLHHRCDPRPESSGYTIRIERIRNPGDFIAWSAHLAGKQWLEDTDWIELMETIAVQLGGNLA